MRSCTRLIAWPLLQSPRRPRAEHVPHGLRLRRRFFGQALRLGLHDLRLGLQDMRFPGGVESSEVRVDWSRLRMSRIYRVKGGKVFYNVNQILNLVIFIKLNTSYL